MPMIVGLNRVRVQFGAIGNGLFCHFRRTRTFVTDMKRWLGADFFSHRRPLARFRLCVAPSDGSSLRVRYDIDPLRVRRGLGIVVVVPVPPLVRWSLRITIWRVLPRL